jgi:hypothetical protein
MWLASAKCLLADGLSPGAALASLGARCGLLLLSHFFSGLPDIFSLPLECTRARHPQASAGETVGESTSKAIERSISTPL